MYAARRGCSNATRKEEQVDLHDAGHPSPTDGEERTLPHILSDIAKDKQIVQTFSDVSEASEAILGHDNSSRPTDDTIAFEVFEKIVDVQAFLKELNERQKNERGQRQTETQEAPSQRSKSVLSSNETAPGPYLPQHLAEEVSIIVGRDPNGKRLDISLQQVVDVLHDMDRRIERQVPDVDNLRVPRGRTPLLMALKMWIPQQVRGYPYTSAADLMFSYMGLTKLNLTMFVTMSAVGGYFLAPFDFNAMALLGTIVGTTLCSGAANAINQLMEIPFDCQMARTRDRPLVRAQLSPLHALTFAIASVSAGTAILYVGANGLVAALGLGNFLLYTCVYTPMKRFTIYNTWAGAIVGAIPPLMGWAAATGSLEMGSLLLAGILYCWQFPHFNALSWNLRADYSRAGYCMMSVTDPDLCKRVTLRHCIFLHAICLAAAPLDVTTWFFTCCSFFLNAGFTFFAWKFYCDGDAKSSRYVFKYSLYYLPIILAFLIIMKKRETDTAEPKKRTENFHALSSLIGL